MVEWKFGNGPIKADDLFKKVEVDGNKLTIHLVDGNVIKIDNYYKKSYTANDKPKTVYDKKQIEAIMDQIELVMVKNYRDYSQELHEPLLSNIITLERFAMTIERIGLQYDAAFNYQYMAGDLLCERAGIDIATKFVKKAQELNDEWKRDNRMYETDVDRPVAYFIDAFDALSKVNSEALRDMDMELREYDIYKVYPTELPLWDMGAGVLRISTDADEIRKHYDRFFDSLLADEYVAMAKIWIATNLEVGNEKSMVSGIRAHITCCLKFFNLEQKLSHQRSGDTENLGMEVSITPARYLDMARAVFKNAQKAFDSWSPSQQMIDNGSYQSFGEGLLKLKNALYG